ncbi:MAG: molybdopterin-dependent oxidoreductase [Planctomycetota bacterium]|nr:molybdopterin-dependent oxidoreductase [Planctomycetota bacterium]
MVVKQGKIVNDKTSSQCSQETVKPKGSDSVNNDDARCLTRRDLLKSSALLGGSALIGGEIRWIGGFLDDAQADHLALGQGYELAKSENILYTTCLQCNTGCEIKTKILNGVVVKIDGNPYGPRAMWPHVPYESSPFDMSTVDGVICPKGQAGIQTHYDPYRIVEVLKRASKRGESKWVTIPFAQAIEEIVNGGYLFSKVTGEENRYVTGLKDIWALRDPALARSMSDDVEKIWDKKITVEEFKTKYAAQMDKLIDPEHPDLGPKNNQFVFMWGRLKGGRSEMINRFTRDSLGSVNAHGHTTVCQGSLYFTGKAMSEQYTGGKWTGGKKAYWMADTANTEFIIYIGASPMDANYGPPLKAQKITGGIVEERLKIAVVDPRFSKTAAKAWRWVPIKPGTEAAFALGMIRWIVENERYDRRFLENANRGAAKTENEPAWTNSSWLVKIEADGMPLKFLRANEIGLGNDDSFVVLRDGRPATFKCDDEESTVKGDLFVDTVIGGISVKSALQLVYESAASRTIDEWAQICGISSQDIIDLAREFTSHGKRAVVEPHRGVAQHTNGFYNVLAVMTLNLLIGNFDWKGGAIYGGGTYDQTGSTPGKPFNCGKHPAKITPFGVSIIRHEISYEKTTLFAGYPAKRNWYPFASDIYQEIIPSAGDAYPYPIKALFIYMGTPVYALPAGHKNIEILTDPNKIPLIVANDITIGETSMYADYIFPDLSYLERWEFHGTHPSIPQKVSPVRQPVVPPLTETVAVFGQQLPLSLEAMLLGIAEKMGFPGFGTNGFEQGKDLKRPEDIYLRMVSNIAFGDKSDGSQMVPDESDEGMQLFFDARRHLPRAVFDSERWEQIVGPQWWRKVVYILNRGGRFENYDEGWLGDQMKCKYGKLANIYLEKVASTRSAMTGEYLPGHAVYLPIRDALGREVNDEGFDFTMITHREIFQTKSRTIGNYWLLDLMPENFILMNWDDALRVGLKNYDLVKIVSATNLEGVWDLKNGQKIPMIGEVKIVQGIRPGVISFALGFGHWAVSASDCVIDGELIPADARRAGGVHGNAAMRVDDYFKNTCMVDTVGGSVSFYDTRVKVVKVV